MFAIKYEFLLEAARRRITDKFDGDVNGMKDGRSQADGAVGEFDDIYNEIE